MVRNDEKVARRINATPNVTTRPACTPGTGNSSGKLVQDPEPKVEQTPDFDLRIQGVSQVAILQDETKMRENNEQVNKVKAGSNKISVRNDLAKDGMIFREESSRAVHGMGNVELIELKQTSETTQCPSCLKHVFKGMTMCQCDKLLDPIKVRWTESEQDSKH